MKFVVLACFVASCMAGRLENTYLPPSNAGSSGGSGIAPPQENKNPPIAIISQTDERNEDGSYKYSYETENGIKVNEEGQIKNKGSENEILSVTGSFSYTGPDGKLYTVTYIADENGFQPQGDHLPTPPPIPAEILASLEQNRKEEATASPGGYPSGPSGGGNGYPSGGPSNQYVPPARPGNGNGGNGNNGYRY